MTEDQQLSQTGRRLLWTLAGLLSLTLGIIGVFLPVLPATPLVLVAAFCFGKGSPALRRWILAHETFGPMVVNWEKTGAIPRKAKRWTCGAMAITLLACLTLSLPLWIYILQAILMAIGAMYVLTRSTT